MKICVKSGLLFYDWPRLIVVTCEEADRIAQANGLVYAERVASEYDGCLLTLNPETLAIEKVRRAR